MASCMFEQHVGRGLRCHILHLLPCVCSWDCPVPLGLALTPAPRWDVPLCHGSDSCQAGRGFPHLGTGSQGDCDLLWWKQFDSLQRQWGGLSPPATVVRPLLISQQAAQSSSEQGCNFGPFQLAFCSPALTGC